MQIMSGYQNTRTASCFQRYRGDFRLTIGGCVCFIQQCHGLYTHLAGLIKQCQILLLFVILQQIYKGAADKAAQLSFPESQHSCMRQIGAQPLQSVQNKLLQGTHSLFPVLQASLPCQLLHRFSGICFFNRPADIRCGKVSIRYRHEQIVHKLFVRCCII